MWKWYSDENRTFDKNGVEVDFHWDDQYSFYRQRGKEFILKDDLTPIDILNFIDEYYYDCKDFILTPREFYFEDDFLDDGFPIYIPEFKINYNEYTIEAKVCYKLKQMMVGAKLWRLPEICDIPGGDRRYALKFINDNHEDEDRIVYDMAIKYTSINLLKRLGVDVNTPRRIRYNIYKDAEEHLMCFNYAMTGMKRRWLFSITTNLNTIFNYLRKGDFDHTRIPWYELSKLIRYFISSSDEKIEYAGVAFMCSMTLNSDWKSFLMSFEKQIRFKTMTNKRNNYRSKYIREMYVQLLKRLKSSN